MANRKWRRGRLEECCTSSRGRVRMHCFVVVDLADISRSHPTSPSAEHDMQIFQSTTEGFGFWNARKRIQLERFDKSCPAYALTDLIARPLNDVGSRSSAATTASFTGTEIPYDSIVNRDRRQHENHLLNTAEIAQWSNSVTAPFNNIHPPMLPYDDPVNSIQHRSQAYGEPYEPNYSAVPTLATCKTSDGHSTTDAVYTTNNRNPNPYEGGNAKHTQTPCSPISMDFDPMNSHIHGYPPQPSRAHGQDFTFGTEKTTMSAQSPPIRANHQSSRSYEEFGTAQGHEGNQSFY